MNSSFGKSNNKSGSINAFEFDLGLGSGRAKPMNDQKNQTSSYTYSSAPQRPSTTSSWGQQPYKPAWIHQPAAAAQSGGAGSLSGPTSMVGDIFGKSWTSSAPSSSSVGIVNGKNPNLFGDLVGSAMGQNKSGGNVPLKNAAPDANRSAFSMGGMADSLPKTGGSAKNTTAWGSNMGNNGGNVNVGGNYNKSPGFGGGNVNLAGNGNKSPNLGGPSMKSMAGSGAGGGGLGARKDPFATLVDFESKPVRGMNSTASKSGKTDFGNDPFGEFQNAPSKTSTSSFPSSSFPTTKTNTGNDPFGEFQNTIPKTSTSSFSSNAAPKTNPLDDFGFSNAQTNTQTQPSSGINDFNGLFSSSSTGGVRENEGGDDWGFNSEFEGGNDNGGTTELEGLPPPPAGVSAPSAKNKGMDNYKQGQFADAIKWLSWAVVLLQKAGDDEGTKEALVCRASCYKEVGEYKKAVADCTKVLENNASDVSVLVQRALLYESMEKYKLGAEDLRTVMKIDPANRVARSTIHRLTKMAE